MAQAKQGDTVSIHYTGRLLDGTVFDSSEDRDPLQFTIGEGNLIPGFEDAVRGMEVGEEKTATVPAGEAYGEHRDDLVISVRQDQLPSDLEPETGQRLQMRTGDGPTFQVVVTEVAEDTVQVDANHPLAGHDLTFDIQLVEIG